MKYNASLVIEGGGMRTAYTMGVLDYFMEQDIDFTYLISISAGVGTGMNFISKQIGRSLTFTTDYSNDKRVAGIGTFLKTGAYFNLDFIYNELEKEIYFDEKTFAENESEFKVGCFNMETGDVRYFNKDEIIQSRKPVIASNSLPILSKIVTIDGEKYMDGGIRDSIPLNKSLEDGNQKNVVILTNPSSYRREKEKQLLLIKARYFNYPKLIEAMEKRHLVYNEMLDKITQMESTGEIFVIRPSKDLGVTRYSRDKESLTNAYEQGKIDANTQHQALIDYLN
jgi:predicted patatin/cPLA2 family phospholipase